MYKRILGAAGEDAVCCVLRNRGWEIMARNYRTRFGEIDIIASHDETLHFIEVKTRSGEGFGRPAEAVSRLKLAHLRTAAGIYLQNAGESESRCSFDVAEVAVNILEGVD